MKIPDSFKMGRNKWYVALAPYQLPKNTYGRVYPQYKLVQINKLINRTPRQKFESFWHEATHAILYDMGDPRWNDEVFVTAFSKRLNQIIQTAEFKDGKA